MLFSFTISIFLGELKGIFQKFEKLRVQENVITNSLMLWSACFIEFFDFKILYDYLKSFKGIKQVYFSHWKIGKALVHIINKGEHLFVWINLFHIILIEHRTNQEGNLFDFLLFTEFWYSNSESMIFMLGDCFFNMRCHFICCYEKHSGVSVSLKFWVLT